ncbi:MAG: discoidin domain-containing protein [Bacteroidaceae bacterium]|nr:discoidin domain-containing protein [Bacteroidaceae bacterium]
MRKIKLLFAAALSMIAWTGVMAQTAAEYEAALAAINDGAQYRISTDVSGTKYYVTAGGTLTADKAKGDAFTFAKVTGGDYVVNEAGDKAVGIQLTSSAGTRFTNGPLSSDKAVLEVANFSTSTNNRAGWESQVFFLKDGKYAIRSCNVAYGESSWADAGRTFWTYTVDPVDPEYTYDPAYVWELEEYTESAEQKEALAKVQAWPVYVQSAAGLVKDAGKFYSNAKEPSEGSYEALIDGDYSSFFHSAWSADGAVDEDHYLQAELSEATQKFEFYYKKRSQNNNNRPTKIVISAGNDAEGEFTEIKTIDSGLPTDASVIDFFSEAVDLGAAYKFVRFTILETNNGAENNGHKFFTFSEFYLFPEAAAQLAPIYNTYSSALAGDLAADDVAMINTVDKVLKSQIATITVTYQLVEADGTVVEKKEVVQKPYSDVEIPSAWASNTKFYDYTVEGTIGDTDCTITVKRTLKEGIVGTLADLSNTKAYTVTCDRGAMLTNGETIASTSNSAYADAEPGQFALVNYDGKYFLYSVADKKFVLNNGYLSEKLVNGELDALQMTPMTVPYFFFYFTTEGGNYGVNTNGSGNLGGIVINSWMNADPGNQYYMVEAADFDPTAALAALDAYFNPAFTVTYVVKDTEGNVIFTSDPEPSEEGAKVTTLPAKYQRAYYTYDEVDVTVTEADTKAEFTATWDGPFTISPDFENAKWYNMTMRGTWYVTTDVKDGDGAYKTQNANIMGLGEDSYQWAFIGNGYDGFQIFNKAEGADKSFGWTDATATNAGIPTIMANEEGYHAWKIVASTNTSVPAGSFCLNVPGTDLYINQYGGAGGSVKFWNSGNNIGDPGSAFTVYDVPSDFSAYVVSDVAPAMEATGYFTFTDAAKAAIGYDPAYKESCSFDTFKSMMAKIKEALNDVNNFILPETGYYTLTSKSYGTFMGIDPSDGNVYGNYKSANAAKNVVKLTKTGEATYTIGLMGKFAPATVAQSGQVTASAEAGTYTVVVPAVGYAAFSPTPEETYTYLHCASGGSVVGWEPTADATQWAVADATSIQLTIGEAGYATAYLPFDVEAGKTISIPAAVGTWTFDDGTTGSLAATAGVTVENGVATVPVGDNLAMATGATELGTYTIMMDVKIVNEDKGRYTSLYKANDNSEDGAIFFYNHKTNGRRIGINAGGMGYGGSYDVDTWYRVVVTCENSIPTVYVNGTKIVAAATASATHWTLGSVVRFFADNDGEENLVQADEIRFWDIALDEAEVGMLGAYGDVVPEPKEVAAYIGRVCGDNKLWLQELDGVIPAMTAVVLKGEPATYEFAIPVPEPDGEALNIYDKEVDGSKALVKAKATDITKNDLKGSFEPVDAVGKYVLAKPEGKEVGFYLAESGTIAAGKAYLEIFAPAGVQAFYFSFDEDPTGIATVEKTVEDGLIYNMAGQRLNKMQKGINIVNGKKILK